MSEASAPGHPNDASDLRALAQQAWDRGEQALLSGETAEALRWLDRAHRLARSDGAITLSLATACLADDPARAAVLFREVAGEHDLREAWLGLAAACLRCDAAPASAAALHEALTRHAPDHRLLSPDDTLADVIARRVRAAGWCGLTGDGTLIARCINPVPIELSLNGKALRERSLPPSWRQARELAVTVNGRHLIGSPIQIPALCRIDGRVALRNGELRGWAWHPGDPDRDPVLVVSGDGGGVSLRITAADHATADDGAAPLARPRSFVVTRDTLRGLRGRLHARGPDGRDIVGSPMSRRAAPSKPTPMSARRTWRGALVMVGSRGDAAAALSRIQQVIATVAAPHRIVVADDSEEPMLRRVLSGLVGRGRLRLVAGSESLTALGGAIAAAEGRDLAVVDDPLALPPGWLERLRHTVHAGRDVRIVVPLSGRIGGADAPLRLDALARKVNRAGCVPVSSATGPCRYIRATGGRPVVATGLFIAQAAAAREGLPGPAARRSCDPLHAALRRIEQACWRASVPRDAESVVLLTHADGGGVERMIGVRVEQIRRNGRHPIVLRPTAMPDGSSGVAIGDEHPDSFPHLSFALPRELPALTKLLRSSQPRLLELHHTLGHSPGIYGLIDRLGVPYDVHVHDYPWFCQRVSLVGPTRRYCEEPPPEGCEACVAEAGRIIDEPITVPAMLDRSTRLLGAARSVCVPSADAASRMRRHFPRLHPRVVPHEDDRTIPTIPPPAARAGRCRVVLLGAIGIHKGFDVVLGCAKDAAARRLPLELVVVGHSIDDAALLATGRVFVTGEYQQDEAVTLIRRQDASLALLPSVWPETWCFALTELWLAGLTVAAFDLGAPAERIRRHGGGLLLPFDATPAAINDTLLAAVSMTSQSET